MRKFIVLVITSLMTVSATAVNWVQVYEQDEFTYYVDSNSLSRSGNSARAFYKFVSTDTEMISLSDINCNSNPMSYKILQVTAFSDGESRSVNIGNSVKYVNPGTTIELIFGLVCAATEKLNM